VDAGALLDRSAYSHHIEQYSRSFQYCLRPFVSHCSAMSISRTATYNRDGERVRHRSFPTLHGTDTRVAFTSLCDVARDVEMRSLANDSGHILFPLCKCISEAVLGAHIWPFCSIFPHSPSPHSHPQHRANEKFSAHINTAHPPCTLALSLSLSSTVRHLLTPRSSHSSCTHTTSHTNIPPHQHTPRHYQHV
jgi:hypothetical protein